MQRRPSPRYPIGQKMSSVMTLWQAAPPPMTSLDCCPPTPSQLLANRKVTSSSAMSLVMSSVMSPVMPSLCVSGVDNSSVSPGPVRAPPPPSSSYSRHSCSLHHPPHRHHHHQSTSQKRLSSTKSHASLKSDAAHIKEVAGDGEPISFSLLLCHHVVVGSNPGNWSRFCCGARGPGPSSLGMW